MTNLHIALAQHAFKVGDIENNAQKIVQLAEQAKQNGADLLVLPELCLLGYPPEDLLLRPSLKRRIDKAFDTLLAVKDIAMLVGFPEVTPQATYNALAIVYNGQIVATYRKQCLPNYGVFDEKRYFSAGNQQVVFQFKGLRIGLLICEDIWQEAPIKQLKKAKVDLVVVANASPFETAKHHQRLSLLQYQAKQNALPIAYLNLVGGQDDLVFDGGSVCVSSSGQVVVDACRFEQNTTIVPFSQLSEFTPSPETVVLTPVAETYQALVCAVRDYVNNSGFKGLLLGLSGGIDSALTLAIAVDALGANRVQAVMMPYTYTAQMSVEDAKAQAERLGVEFSICPINTVVESFGQVLKPYFGDAPLDATEENIQARTRGNILMALSNKHGHLVLTTGNKSEMAVGYATLYGDMCGGFAPLKDVYKTQVFELAKFRNSLEQTPVIPARVIIRPPSAELRPDQTDQDSLPPYPVLDAILYAYIERDLSAHDIVAQGFDEATVLQVLKMVDRNEYKRRQSAPGPRISCRAFGRERRYPLVNGWVIGQ